MFGDGVGFYIGWQYVGGVVVLFCDDDGSNFVWIDWDIWQVNVLFWCNEWNWLMMWLLYWEEDIVQFFQIGGYVQVDFDDYLFCQYCEICGIVY